jgi:7-carboxy-7-deazaguanine synthase
VIVDQFNKQLPMHVDRHNDGSLRVHSMFHTIQGEGPYAGRAAYFIRLFGCNLQCPGCDTDYTSVMQTYTAEELLGEMEALPDELIVITGGEPFRQNITPFVELLFESGYDIQIETNGSLWLDNLDSRICTIVVSPKTAKIHPKLAQFAHAYKYVLQADSIDPEDGLPTIALGHTAGSPRVARPPHGWNGDVYLQPMDERSAYHNARNMRACIASVMQHKRYILGIQMHKEWGLP